MTSSAQRIDARATDVTVTDDDLRVRLVDGRMISVPLAWFPRLLRASSSQRGRWRLIGGGEGIHWPEVDEDVSVAGLLAGLPSQEVSAQGRAAGG